MRVLVGPTGLGLVKNGPQAELRAEIGVILLLLGVGLELSLERMKKLWRAIVLGGALQVSLTVGLSAVFAHLLGL